MFFLLRSAACIGLVVCALPDDGRSPSAPAVAISGITTLCHSAPARCLAVLQAGLKAGSAEAAAAFAQPSRDTLLAADHRPAWRGTPLAAVD